jgi:hypothetical protein
MSKLWKKKDEIELIEFLIANPECRTVITYSNGNGSHVYKDSDLHNWSYANGHFHYVSESKTYKLLKENRFFTNEGFNQYLRNHVITVDQLKPGAMIYLYYLLDHFKYGVKFDIPANHNPQASVLDYAYEKLLKQLTELEDFAITVEENQVWHFAAEKSKILEAQIKETRKTLRDFRAGLKNSREEYETDITFQMGEITDGK